MRLVIGFLLAVLVAYLFAATFASLHVQSQLSDLGVSYPIAERLGHITHDWLGMALGGIFPVVILIGLAIGLSIARLVSRLLGGLRVMGYVLGGAAALIAIHVSLNLAFDMHPIAASRTLAGLLMQGVAGGLGGLLFAWWTRPQATSTATEAA